MDNVIATDNAKLIAGARILRDKAGLCANAGISMTERGFIEVYNTIEAIAAALEQADARIAKLEAAILAATDMLPLCPGCLHHKEAGHADTCIVETIKKGDTK